MYLRYNTTIPIKIRHLDQLQAVSRATISIFSWRHGLDVPPGPDVVHQAASYSEDGEKWFSISLVRSLHFVVEMGKSSVSPNHVKHEEIVSKVEAGADEPLGRQIFREAWSQRNTNPRGALVIGVAAAEVGLKRLIGSLVPQATWLMEEIQTPPVRKMLRDFLPTLPIRAKRLDGGPMSLPSELVREVEKAVEYRNKIVHRGAPAPRKQELINALQAISDLLWICDVFQGHGVRLARRRHKRPVGGRQVPRGGLAQIGF
jgi:hypothetical protein